MTQDLNLVSEVAEIIYYGDGARLVERVDESVHQFYRDLARKVIDHIEGQE